MQNSQCLLFLVCNIIFNWIPRNRFAQENHPPSRQLGYQVYWLCALCKYCISKIGREEIAVVCWRCCKDPLLAVLPVFCHDPQMWTDRVFFIWFLCISVFVYLCICVFVYLCICVFVYLRDSQSSHLNGCSSCVLLVTLRSSRRIVTHRSNPQIYIQSTFTKVDSYCRWNLELSKC